MTLPRRICAPLAFIVAVALVTSGCDGDDPLTPPPGGPASFDLLQSEIFDAQCVVCHGGGSQFAEESGLVLEAGMSYESLIGVQPKHPEARAAGLVLVDSGDPARSFLLRKLRWDLPPDEPTYGARMPMGLDPLSVGEVEFVRDWIAAGAPREGSVVNPDLLEDTTPQPVTDAFEPLALPEQGYQVHLTPFPVQPGTEREIFVSQRVGNDEEIWINRFEVSMRPNSHHFILHYFLPDTPQIPPLGEIRDLWAPYPTNLNGSARGPMTYKRRIGGAQTEDAEMSFPPGVALRMPADATVDLNSHYLNFTDRVLYGEVYANLHTVDENDVDHEAFPLFHNNGSFNIPPHAPGDSTVISHSVTYGEPRHVFMLTSHTHEKGERFEIYAIGGDHHGQLVYETTDWAHPDITYFNPPLVVDGLRAEVTFHNPTNQHVGFGMSSEDEMSIMIGYWYSPD